MKKVLLVGSSILEQWSDLDQIATAFVSARYSAEGESMQSPGNREYYVYVMASWSRTLYIGMTNNLKRRVRQHKDGQGATFTAQ